MFPEIMARATKQASIVFELRVAYSRCVSRVMPDVEPHSEVCGSFTTQP